MSNYTSPNDPDHIDTSEDWLKGALVMASALGHLLKENEGVVVKLNGDAVGICKTDKVIVYNQEDQIHVTECEEDLEDGQMIWMHNEYLN